MLATVHSVLIGIGLGSLARVTMRAITIVEGDEPEFTVGATVGIVSFFVLAALGGGWGGLLSGHPRIGVGIAVVATLPITVLGAGIGGGDVSRSFGDQPADALVLIVLGTALIARCVFSAPVLTWRRSRSPRR